MIKVLETYDKSKYKIVYFSPEQYERMKESVNLNDIGRDNCYGYIEKINAPYAVDVICDEICYEIGTVVEPEYNIYKLLKDDDAWLIEGGLLDLSLSYDEQVEFLINELETVVAKGIRFMD